MLASFGPRATPTLKRLAHRINLRIAVVLVIALLGSQLGAQAHAYSHFRTAAHATDSLATHGGGCPDCLSFAPLLASAGGPSHEAWFSPQSLHESPLSALPSLIPVARIPGFRSRAPPPSTH